jgi:transketolase
MGWHDIVGDAGRIVSIEHFGASADYQTLFREFGITADAVVKAAKDSLKAAKGSAGSGRTVPGVTETAPQRAEQSADTDVMGTDVTPGAHAASAEA